MSLSVRLTMVAKDVRHLQFRLHEGIASVVR
jgi:hypothetical protein